MGGGDLHALLNALPVTAETFHFPPQTWKMPPTAVHPLLLNKDLGRYLLMQKVLILISLFLASLAIISEALGGLLSPNTLSALSLRKVE